MERRARSRSRSYRPPPRGYGRASLERQDRLRALSLERRGCGGDRRRDSSCHDSGQDSRRDGGRRDHDRAHYDRSDHDRRYDDATGRGRDPAAAPRACDSNEGRSRSPPSRRAHAPPPPLRRPPPQPPRPPRQPQRASPQPRDPSPPPRAGSVRCSPQRKRPRSRTPCEGLPSVADYARDNELSIEVQTLLESLEPDHLAAVLQRGPVNRKDIISADTVVRGRVEAESKEWRGQRGLDDGPPPESRWGKRRGVAE
eukprot:TRINITY_DN5410_c2_g1_i2.p1 TRINITY_DN5410_c2_g1~~TRINITY_DN5410_c2_g1_i2.p1  ORF type:complete len:282 (+),score=39.97 TRINITY_DN5410_c2_g1_i2:82-846(+)